jgi:hypothetical protein
MIVVGISGYAGAGKDTVADILVRDYGFTKMAFADPIKAMVKDLDPMVGWGSYCCKDCFNDEPEAMYLSDLYSYGWTDQMIKDSEYGDEVRRIWQRFGTEVHRADSEDYWVEKALERMYDSGHERIVLPDVRFPNEADAIYELRRPFLKWTEDGWTKPDPLHSSSLWRIHREPEPRTVRDIHVSEQMIGLLGEEVTILNKGSLKDLEEPVAIAMKMLLDGVYPGEQYWGPESFDLQPVDEPVQHLKVDKCGERCSCAY